MSVIHLKPPKRHDPPLWLTRPLGRLQSPDIPWPRAWAALLLLVSGVAHMGRIVWMGAAHHLVTIPMLLVALFGFCYILLGIWLRIPGQRALVYGAAVPALGLGLGTISFVTSYDQAIGVNWIALSLLMLDVLVVPLCMAGLPLPRFKRSATR